MTQRVGIIVPSYNEAENISLLIKGIVSSLPDAVIIIVDDSSPNENKKLLSSLKSNHLLNKNRITVVSRLKKLGRGSAVIAGLKAMLQNKSVQYFFEMDSDLAHDPKDFSKFLSAIKSNRADVVIGSRYLDSSKVIKWPLWRLVLSRVVNTFINIWLDLNLSDYTNGFRLYKRNAVEFLITVELREKGFISLSEIAYRLKSNNFKLVEIPVSVTYRTYGKSSADYREFISSLIGIMRIKLLPLKFRTVHSN